MKIKKVPEKVLDVHTKRKMKMHIKETRVKHTISPVSNEKEGKRIHRNFYPLLFLRVLLQIIIILQQNSLFLDFK